MKSIAIVTDSEKRSLQANSAAETVRHNILEVFSGSVTVKNYYIDKFKDFTRIDEDLVLVMIVNRIIKVKKHVSNTNNIIVAKRTFLKSGIRQLFKIPEDSDVLVVNDDMETILESVSSLYQIGIKHVNLIPYKKGENYHHLIYALSPGEPHLVPQYIPKQYDLGGRVVDIPTMLMIIRKLDLNEKRIHQNLYSYYQKIFSSNRSESDNYSQLMTRTEQLDNLLDLSTDGMLLTDKNGEILVCNRRFKEIFEIKDNVVGKIIHHIIHEIDLRKYYQGDYSDDLVTFKNKSLKLEKKNITHYNKKERLYFKFQEVTYIKKLEQDLSRKLREKGQIAKYSFDDIVYSSSRIRKAIDKSKKIATTDLTVLITGESGTGKEVLAQAIHNDSLRKTQPFIAINGAAIPENLLESELFGYTEGSFTGALKGGKKGLFERANNGTIFLDEIGDMPIHLQSKLLRVLQERQITPLGSDRIIDIDVRIIAATHKNPMDMIANGNFRKDLFYRLNVFPIELPPLRKRKEDIMLLFRHFTRNSFKFTDSFMEKSVSYPWPGNIRELSNIAIYISTIAESDTITADMLPEYIQNHQDELESLNKSSSNIISEKSEIDVTMKILKVIKILNEIEKTAGRKHLLEIINEEDKLLTESKLRRILDNLKKSELIFSRKGRSGNYLTEKGILFIRQNS